MFLFFDRIRNESNAHTCALKQIHFCRTALVVAFQVELRVRQVREVLAVDDDDDDVELIATRCSRRCRMR